MMIWPVCVLLIVVPLLIVAHFEEAARIAARLNMLDEKLSGIADALSAGFDGLGGVINEIQGDIIELKEALASTPTVSEATIAKFDSLKAKFDGLRESLASVAAIVPEAVIEVVTEEGEVALAPVFPNSPAPVVEPPVVVDPELG